MYYSMEIEGDEVPWNTDLGAEEPREWVSSESAEAREGMAKAVWQETSSMNE